MLSFKCVVCDRGALPIFCFLINHQEKICGGTNTWVSGIAYFACRYPYAFVKRERPRSPNFS